MDAELIPDLEREARGLRSAGFPTQILERAVAELTRLRNVVADYERLGHGQVAPTNGTRTSNRAADTWTAPRLAGKRLDVLRVLDGGGAFTEEELSALTGYSGNTVRPRLLECRRAGWVEDAHDDRPTSSGAMAKTWQITAAGTDALDRLMERAS